MLLKLEPTPWHRLGIVHDGVVAITTYVAQFQHHALELSPPLPNRHDVHRAIGNVERLKSTVEISPSDFLALSPLVADCIFHDSILLYNSMLGRDRSIDLWSMAKREFIDRRVIEFWATVKAAVPNAGPYAGECVVNSGVGSLQTHVFTRSLMHALYLPICAWALKRPTEAAYWSHIASFIRSGNYPIARRRSDHALLILTA